MAELSTVSIIKGENPIDMVVKALEAVKAEKAFKNDEKILIKPNYINASHPSTGITTDARVIDGVIKFLKEKGFHNLVIGEGSGLADTMAAFKVAGVDKVAERWGIKLIDLNKDEYLTVNVPDVLALKTVNIAKTALESAVISVPKLKLHRMAGVTLSMKNMMGVVKPKGQIHHPLGKKIVDLVSVVKPRLAVIDGVIGGEGHELSGRPVQMNIVIAGLDPVAVDTVGAEVMGFNHRKVEHIMLAAEKNLGICDLNRIRVIGRSIENVRRVFKRSFSYYILSRFS